MVFWAWGFQDGAQTGTQAGKEQPFGTGLQGPRLWTVTITAVVYLPTALWPGPTHSTEAFPAHVGRLAPPGRGSAAVLGWRCGKRIAGRCQECHTLVERQGAPSPAWAGPKIAPLAPWLSGRRPGWWQWRHLSPLPPGLVQRPGRSWGRLGLEVRALGAGRQDTSNCFWYLLTQVASSGHPTVTAG